MQFFVTEFKKILIAKSSFWRFIFPIHLRERGTLDSTGFFVQSIFTDRYHCTVLCKLLKIYNWSFSIVNFRFFLWNSLFPSSYVCVQFCERKPNFPFLFHIFVIFNKFWSFSAEKMTNLLRIVSLVLYFEKKELENFFNRNWFAKFAHKYLNNLKLLKN